MERQAGARCESHQDYPLVVFEIRSQDLKLDARRNRVPDQRNVSLVDGQQALLWKCDER